MNNIDLVPVLTGLTAVAIGAIILAQAVFYMVQLLFKRTKILGKYKNFSDPSVSLVNIGWMIFLEFWGVFLITLGASLICLSFDPERQVPLTQIITAVSFYMFFLSLVGSVLILPIMAYGFIRSRKNMKKSIDQLYIVDDEDEKEDHPDSKIPAAA